MSLELAASRFTRCEVCNKGIPKSGLRLTIYRTCSSSLYYHLTCWKPEPSVPITMEDLWSDELPKELKREVEAWVRNWNKQFEAVEEDVPEKYMSKAVATTDTALRRLLLEVLQYLTTSETETLVAFACKEWFHVSRDEELWKGRFISEFTPLETEAQGSYRRKYIAFLWTSCWHCKKRVQLDQIEFKCPYFKRPLCWKCGRDKDCAIETVSYFTSTRGVTKTTIETLSIPHFSHYQKQSSYLMLYRDKLLPHAENRRKLLLRTIEANFPGSLSPEERRMLEIFDLGRFYYEGWDRRKLSSLEKGLVKFCGKCGNRENTMRSAQQFLEEIHC